MTTIKKFLDDNPTGRDKATATVILDFTQQEKSVKVTLAGKILSKHIDALRDFLKNVTYFPGNQWLLQLEGLEVISRQGLRVLIKFTSVIRQRGYEVEIMSIHPAMLATLLELNLSEYFTWGKFKMSAGQKSASHKKTDSHKLVEALSV